MHCTLEHIVEIWYTTNWPEWVGSQISDMRSQHQDTQHCALPFIIQIYILEFLQIWKLFNCNIPCTGKNLEHITELCWRRILHHYKITDFPNALSVKWTGMNSGRVHIFYKMSHVCRVLYTAAQQGQQTKWNSTNTDKSPWALYFFRLLKVR